MIETKIEEVVTGTHLIRLDRDDFALFPTAYVEIEIDHVSKINSLLPSYNEKLLDVIVSVCSYEDMKLSEINKIVSEIECKYNNNLNVIYGFNRSSIHKQTKIIIFIIN